MRHADVKRCCAGSRELRVQLGAVGRGQYQARCRGAQACRDRAHVALLIHHDVTAFQMIAKAAISRHADDGAGGPDFLPSLIAQT
jgi:hypothetical protein